MINFGKHILLAAMIGTAGSMAAQDSYDAGNFSTSDLNGTTRFVSMGGALGALGGDISVMSTNPAGTATYRRGDAAFTLSGQFTNDGAMGHDASRMSFDQAGAVFTFDMFNPSSQGLQFVNFGINYQKRRNFLSNSIFDIGRLNGFASQTWQIADMANQCYDAYGFDTDNWGTMADMARPLYEYDEDNDKYDIVSDGIIADNGQEYLGTGAKSARYERATYGGVSQVDANLSFNCSDRFFYGFSIGLYDVNYNRESSYMETGTDGCDYEFRNWYNTSGQGFDLKLGFICRPVEDSPFRFGLTVHTPTWYGLTDANGASLYFNGQPWETNWTNGDFSYQLRTPWKFGVSLGHTVGQNIAFGAEYEYQDLASARYDNAEGDYNSDTREYFRNINMATKQTLKGQHTLKLGMEYKPVDDVAFRIGYNYVSSPFRSNAIRTITADGVQTETDYTNWKDMHRFCMGVGFRFNGGYADIAYQYTTQKGDFYAFHDEYGSTDSRYALAPTSITNERSQLMATLGFRF